MRMKIGVIFFLLLITFIITNEINENYPADQQIKYENPADQLNEEEPANQFPEQNNNPETPANIPPNSANDPRPATEPIPATELHDFAVRDSIETPANIPPNPATDPRPATDPIPATELHDFGKRDLISDTIENSYVLIAEGFLKIEFYFFPANESTEIVAFIIAIKGDSEDSPVEQTSRNPNIYPYTLPSNSTVYYSSLYWENLRDDNYTINISVVYADLTESPVLLQYKLNNEIHQPCNQETFAAFFSQEIYSIVPLNNDYNFCGFNWELFVQIEVEEGNLAIFHEDKLSMGIIVFRGEQTTFDFTQDSDDWFVPVDCFTVYDFNCAGTIGLSVSRSYNALKNTVNSNEETFLDLVENLKEMHGTSNILLTGHSKGAAEASLAILDIHQTNLFNDLHITTFGFPAYADEDFAIFWNTLVQPATGLDDIKSTWHYHMDSIGHRDVFVYTPIEVHGKFPFKYQSRYFDLPCTSDLDCHSLLLYPNTSSRTIVNAPTHGYYFVGADALYYGFQSDLYLAPFVIPNAPTSTPTASKSLTPSMFSPPSPSRTSTPDPSVTASRFSSRSPTATRSETPAASIVPTGLRSRTRSRTPTPSIFSSPSPSHSSSRSPSSTPSLFSSLSSTRSNSPTHTTTHPSPSPSTSLSPTPSKTEFFSESPSPSRSNHPSSTPSHSQISQTPAPTSPTITQSISHSSSKTPSKSFTSSNTPTPSTSAVSLSATNRPFRTRSNSPLPAEENSSFPLFSSVNIYLFSVLFFVLTLF